MKTPIQTHHALCGLMSALLFTAAGTFTAHADLINEDFSSGTLPATLEISAGSNVSFTGGVALFDGANNAVQTALRTVEDDFYGQSFVAEVTVTQNVGANFFGMGNGGLGGGFNAPLNPTIWLDMRILASDWSWQDSGTPAGSGSIGAPGGGISACG